MDSNSSPYAHILHTNRAPSIDEIDAIKAYLLEPEAKLRRLEAEIGRMRVILDGLESEHVKLKLYVESHKALLSPIKRIPPELLQEVFVRCLPESSRNCVMHAREAPLLLTCICSGWREIAISTPELWSSLHIVAPPRFRTQGAVTNFRMRLLVQNARQWLLRSGTRPLHVSLYIEEWDVNDFLPLIESLEPFVRRFKRLELIVPESFLVQLGPQDVPQLQVLIIRLPNNVPFTRDFWFLSKFNQMSSLRRVCMKGPVLINHTRFLPLSQLQNLELQCVCDALRLLDVLRHCINLQEFFLQAPMHSMPLIDTGGQLVVLPYLRVLILRGQDTLIQSIMRTLVVPELQYINIAVPSIQDYVHRHMLPSALFYMITLSSCGPKLRKLNFPDIPGSFDELVQCLSLMPNLVHLELNAFDVPTWQDGRIIGDALLRRLTAAAYNPSACLLPHLQIIQLSIYHGISDEVLLDFARSRRQSIPGIAPLLNMIVGRVVEEVRVISPGFAALREGGLYVRVDSLQRGRPPQPYNPWQGLES